jgi:hypothetical protein
MKVFVPVFPGVLVFVAVPGFVFLEGLSVVVVPVWI